MKCSRVVKGDKGIEIESSAKMLASAAIAAVKATRRATLEDKPVTPFLKKVTQALKASSCNTNENADVRIDGNHSSWSHSAGQAVE